ncbi:putative clathrin assembly protein At1g03050 [Bidens hawaiensis]|uniref:putative clathrin assembly protein At1g03050 n=1 Tax=Bidens hawaiensis TaxID=980011 RepID=UPI00404B84E5
MMGRFSRAIAAVKDHTSIRLAQRGSLADLDVAIVKATSHNEYPAEECYIQQILTLTSDSPLYVSSCVNTISRRLNKTRSWVVALKTLMLVHRLLRDGNKRYAREIFCATRRGTRMLNMSDFRDTLRSSTWDYAAFVRMYSLFLDEELEYKMQGKKGTGSSFALEENEEEEEQVTEREDVVVPVREMENEQLFARITHLTQLIERFLACRPAGEARHDRMVMVALYTILTQSFQIYSDIKEVMGELMDRFEYLALPHATKVYNITNRVAKQYTELDMFYDWCKSVGIARTSEYPEVEKITQKKLQAMDGIVKLKSDET